MQFKKIIKQQEFTDKKLQHLPELYNPSHLPYFSSNKEKKDEITKDIKVVDNEAYTGLRDTNRVYEDKNEKMKEKVTRVELKEQPQLSSDERRLVGDISKLFAFQPSRPTKILVRMNQTQTNRSNMPNSPRENRLDKIEITRLENDKYDKTPNQYANRQLVKQNGHYLKQFKGSQINSERQSSCENESLVNVHHSSENILPPPIQIPIKRFLIARQLSIMFVPDYNYSTSIGMKNPPLLFTKFREKNFKDGLNSATSNCSSDSLRIKDEPLQGERQNNKFIKLMDIQLFQKRKEVQHARAQQLRHANEKLLASHLIQKEQLQINIQVIKKFEKQLKTRIMELQRQVQVEREKVKQLILDIEIKQKSNKSLLKLNQQYLKQNNDLKHKIKEYIKNIHDLKAQLTIKEKTGVQTHAEIPLPVIVEKIKEVKKTKAAYPPLPSFSNLPRANYDRAEPILRKQLTFSQINEGNYINNQFFEANPDYTHHRQDTLSPHNFTKPSEKPQGKLINSKSHGIIRLPERVQDGSSGGRQAHYDLTARSQRNVGIKKNHQNQQPISPTTKNLVRVNKNIHNDASIIIAEKLRDNKSLSSISNLSGKSLSQRVGYVLKPTPKDPNNGILVDYMIQEQPKKLQETQKIIQQGKRQRLKLKRND